MLRVRRVSQRLPLGRRYEVQYAPRSGTGWHRVTRVPNEHLEPLLGVGDAWSFVQAADAAWDRGEHGWAVEFEESNDNG